MFHFSQYMLGPVNLDEEKSSMSFNYKAFKYQYIASTKQSFNATRLHILDPVSPTTSKWLIEWNTVLLVWYILHQHFFLVLMYCLKNDQECIINFLALIYLDLVLFWSKKLNLHLDVSLRDIWKPLLAAESRSVLLGKLEPSEMLFLLLLLFTLWYFFSNISNDSYAKMKGYLN